MTAPHDVTSDRMPAGVACSEVLNYDFAKHDLDDVITAEMMEASGGIRGLAQGVAKHLDREVTVRDLAAHRATLLQGPRFVGTPDKVADQMQEWFESGGCDGFVLAATHLPGRVRGVRADGRADPAGTRPLPARVLRSDAA